MAVVTSASEMPPATTVRPEAWDPDISRKALMMPMTVPNRPTNGAVEPIVASPARLRVVLLQARGNHPSQMTLLVALSGGDLDGFVDLAFLERPGHGRGKRARLVARRREGHPTIDHDADGPAGHQEQDNDDELGRNAHLLPKMDRVPANLRLLEEQDCGLMQVAQN